MMQLTKALRETIPEGGILDGGAGEDIFSGLLDGELSVLAAARFERGLGAALHRRLSGGADGGTDAASQPGGE
ncbi:MAG TPA: rod-binding protein [Longimicrobiales bacterium]